METGGKGIFNSPMQPGNTGRTRQSFIVRGGLTRRSARRSKVGIPVFWHNRLGLPLLDSSAHPDFVSEPLWPLIEMVAG
jgi:hypothetical protein